jgi:hypothetical protein
MVVTPDEAAFGTGGYPGYGPGSNHAYGSQGQLPSTHIVSANTSPASSRPSVGPIGYGQPPVRKDRGNKTSTPRLGGLHAGGGSFPGQLNPNPTTIAVGQPTDASKLPGRYSLDARLQHADPLDRPEIGPRSASMSVPAQQGTPRHAAQGQPIMVVQADGMIEESVPGQANVIKRMSRDDYFEGVFTPNHGMDPAVAVYGTVPSSTTPKLPSHSTGAPSLAIPFDKANRSPNEMSNGPGSEVWPRW